jgi:Rad3-related DNA helicase
MRAENDMTRLLSADGPIAHQLAGFRERPAQIEAARLIARGIETDRAVVVELGTGGGKGLAYLAAIVASGRQAIVATATTTLQDQLAHHDLPLLERAIGGFTWAVLKGANRYLCLRDLDLAHDGKRRGQLDVPTADELAPLDVACADSEWVGDLETLDGLAETARAAVAASPDRCIGKACPLIDRCYWKAAQKRAREADVLVTNHTLLAIDLKIGGHILPAHLIVAVDEAHVLADNVRQQLTVTVTPGKIAHLLRDIRHAELPPAPATPDGPPDESLARVGDQLHAIEHTAESLWNGVREALDTAELRHGPTQDFAIELPDRIRLPGRLLLLAVAGLADPMEIMAAEWLSSHGEETSKDVTHRAALQASWSLLIGRTRNLADDLRLIFAEDDASQVRSTGYAPQRAGARERPIFVAAQPLDVAPILHERLFDRRTVILTSATLTTGGTFAYFARQTGVPDGALALSCPYLFDFAQHALLYVPRLLEPANPGPSTEQREAYERYLDGLATQMLTLVRANPGGTFLLFTAGRALRAIHTRLIGPLADARRPLFVQGDESRGVLIERFRLAPGAVLLGLHSFWEGVDIPGEALTLVAIDRIPFLPPDDPLERAQDRAIENASGDPFHVLTVPRAALRLKQGLGRLIRSEQDQGVMAVLDARLHTRGYGRSIVRSLPPAPVTASLAAVQTRFEHLRGHEYAS